MDANKPRTSDVPATPAASGRSSFDHEFREICSYVGVVAHGRLLSDFDNIASSMLARGHPLGGQSHSRALFDACERHMREAFSELEVRMRDILQSVERLPTADDIAHCVHVGGGTVGALLSSEALRQLDRGNQPPAADVDELLNRLDSLAGDHAAAIRLRALAAAAAARDARDATLDRRHTRTIAWLALLVSVASALLSGLQIILS